MGKFSNAPLATIDVASLKASRFLHAEEDGTPVLPYRDDTGAVNINLCRASASDLREARLCCPAATEETLNKWLKHAEHWAASDSAPSWKRREHKEGPALWRSSSGVERLEVAVAPAPLAPRNGSRAARTKRAAADPAMPGAKRLASGDGSLDGKASARAGGSRSSSTNVGGRKISYKGAVQQTRYGSGCKPMSTGGTVRVVVKGRAAVDASCPKADECHVYEQGDDIHDVLLNQTNIGENKNKYYIIQLLETDASPRQYWCWNRWGRVGEERGYQNALRGPMSLPDALADFTRKFSDKTRNAWEDRGHFETQPNKYTLIERDYGEAPPCDAEPPEADSGPPPECSLEARVAKFVELICNEVMFETSMREVGFDSRQMPLGKLKPATITQAFDALRQISEILQPKGSGPPASSHGGGGSSASDGTKDGDERRRSSGARSSSSGGAVSRSELLKLSNRFYTLIPHISLSETGGTRARLQPIESQAMLQAKMRMLEALSNIELASSIIAPKERIKTHPLDARYAQMQAELKPVERGGPLHKLLSDYLTQTHAPTHMQYKLELLQAFEVRRQGEHEAFVDLGNRKLLWHGSRLTNWAGILKGGLRIAPPEAPATGYMFGKGVYFADLSSKSANYCFATEAAPFGVLSLCEVSLGKQYECTQAEYDAPLRSVRKGKDSTLGCGKSCPNPKSTRELPGSRGLSVPMGKYAFLNTRTTAHHPQPPYQSCPFHLPCHARCLALIAPRFGLPHMMPTISKRRSEPTGRLDAKRVLVFKLKRPPGDDCYPPSC